MFEWFVVVPAVNSSFNPCEKVVKHGFSMFKNNALEDAEEAGAKFINGLKSLYSSCTVRVISNNKTWEKEIN